MLNAMQRAAKDAAAAHFGGPEASISDPSSNIIGWGIGTKTTDETVLSNENVVRIYVRELLSDQVIPEQFEGLPTDVIEVGEITADQGQGAPPANSLRRFCWAPGDYGRNTRMSRQEGWESLHLEQQPCVGRQ